jgi:hypothetical protein
MEGRRRSGGGKQELAQWLPFVVKEFFEIEFWHPSICVFFHDGKTVLFEKCNRVFICFYRDCDNFFKLCVMGNPGKCMVEKHLPISSALIAF